MGVSGCGKSSVAEKLAKATGGAFLDADDFRPPANKAKMASGIPSRMRTDGAGSTHSMRN